MKKLLIMVMLLQIDSVIAESKIIMSSKGGKLSFEALGRPAMIKIKGESLSPQTKLIFNESAVNLESILNLKELKTGIDLRDEHMKEKYLEVVKYPDALLKISSLPISVDWYKNPKATTAQPFNGTLSLHGREMPVNGTFIINENKNAEAEFKIKLTDYGIEIPDYLGVTVAESVTIKTIIPFEVL